MSPLRYHGKLAIFAVLAAAIIMLAQMPRAHAATITVTNVNDSGPGSLRQAVADAATGDTIDFSVTGTITLTSGVIAIYTGLTIAGPNDGGLAISGNNSSSIFSVFATDAVSILGLTLRDGMAASGSGGAIYISSGATVTLDRVIVRDNISNGSGGGIMNLGSLTIAGSTISGNTIVSTANAGGGIYNQSSGTVEIVATTISANHASSEGGGIQNNGGIVTIINSTISGNTAASEAFGGGGINNGGILNLTNVTITGNHAAVIGGGIHNFSWLGAIVNMKNTIIASNTAGADGPDCMNTLNSLGHNLVGDMAGCEFSGDTTGNLTGADPMLGPLADNDGPTQTHTLPPGSPAIDAGDNDGCPPTDQRGVARPQGPACDIGAYEAGAEVPTLLKGDVDCSGGVDAVDALKVLRFVAGLGVAYGEGCTDMDSGIPYKQGDINCNGGVDAVDALLILRHVAGLLVNLPSDCGPIGGVNT